MLEGGPRSPFAYPIRQLKREKESEEGGERREGGRGDRRVTGRRKERGRRGRGVPGIPLIAYAVKRADTRAPKNPTIK